MGLLIWIIFGALVGWIASMIMNTNDQQGLMTDIGLGVVGAIFGGWLMSYLGQTGITGFNIYSFIVAVVGASILIAAVKMLRYR